MVDYALAHSLLMIYSSAKRTTLYFILVWSSIKKAGLSLILS